MSLPILKPHQNEGRAHIKVKNGWSEETLLCFTTNESLCTFHHLFQLINCKDIQEKQNYVELNPKSEAIAGFS